MTTPLYFDAYTTAIETYPDDNVELKLIEIDPPGKTLNQHEVGTFNVQVTNNGPVTLHDALVRIKGLNGMQVRFTESTDPSFLDEIVTSAGAIDDVEHHQTVPVRAATSGDKPFQFKAPGVQATADLIEVTFEDWTPDFNHINTVHTKATTKVKDTYTDEVTAK